MSAVITNTTISQLTEWQVEIQVTSNGSPEPEPEDCSNRSLSESSCGINASPSESHLDDVFLFTL